MVKFLQGQVVTQESPQRLVLSPLPFLVHINDLADDLLSNAKLFLDEKTIELLQKLKKNAKVSINYYIQSFCETTFRS